MIGGGVPKIQIPDLEKVVNCPQAENLELYNDLKTAWFASMDKPKYMY